MLSRRRTAILVAVLVAAPVEVRAEPYMPAQDEMLHILSPTTGRTDGGTDLRLPPGYFLPEPLFREKDLEMRRLQEAEKRLRAENDSFRKTQKSWQPGWKTLTTVFLTGLVGGAYIRSKI